MSVKIGKTELKCGLMLGPMAGVSDRSFRNICAEAGAEYTVSEMVSAKALHFDDEESKRLADTSLDRSPCAIQLFGHEPDIMAEAAHFLTRECKTVPPAIDINMGCPVRKIIKNGEGSALMNSPELAGRIVRSVAEASSVPVTVKIRSGFSETSKNAVEIARICEENGASLICVHGRTREQMYAPPVDLDIIAQVKRAVNIPVIGNGGIYCAEDALEMLDKTGCDGVMVARGAMGNPWIFFEIKAAIDKLEFTPPSLSERFAAALRQLDGMIEDKGERIAVLEARRHLSYYIKGSSGAAEARGAINCATTLDQLREIVDVYVRKNT